LARISEYRPHTRTMGLPGKAVSRSSAIQRAGRCGRVESGVCIRLYSEEEYESRPLHTPPEILRTNLAEVILRMMHRKLGHISDFPFIDPPKPKAVKDGYDILIELGAIVLDGRDYVLTDRGARMSRLPLDPRIARIIMEARENKCTREILVIASALSVQDPRERPPGREKEADAAQKAFVNASSDFITLLNIWNAFRDVSRAGATESGKKKWCRVHSLSYRRMRDWKSVHDEIKAILKEAGPMKGEKMEGPSLAGDSLYEAVHKSILAGYISQFAVKKEKNVYRFARGREATIFPGSGCFNSGPPWIVSADMVKTSRLYARINAAIKSEWLEEAGADFCRKTWSEAHWDAERGEVTALERVSLFGLTTVEGRTVSLGSVKPEEASEIFIRTALIEGELPDRPAFLRHNQALINRLVTMENKIRKRTILVDDEELAAFYRQRLGLVFDVRTLNKLIKEKGSDEFLRMSEEDVRRWLPKEELDKYPDHISLNGERFSLTYRFAPGEEDDGITMKIPARLLHAVDDGSADLKIPGLLHEKIHALIKGLPKEYRKQLIPITGTVDTLLEDVTEKEEGFLPGVLAEMIRKRYGISIPATAWPVDSLPEHLKIRYALTGHSKQELKASRDIKKLTRETTREEPDRSFEGARRAWERSGLTSWNFGDLPDEIEIPGGGRKTGKAFPALTVEGNQVHLRLYQSGDNALREHRRGLIRLYELQFSRDFKYLKKCLSTPKDIKNKLIVVGGATSLENMLAEKVLEDLMGGTIRTEKAFVEKAEQARINIYDSCRVMLDLVEPILRIYAVTGLRLAELEGANRSSTRMVAFIDSLKKKLDGLVPPDFISRYDKERLSRLPLYIRTVLIRAERGVAHLDKEEGKAKKLAPFIEALEEIRVTLPSFTSREKLRALDEFEWMLEEYAISIFAPELKTAESISPGRLKQKLESTKALI
ncbi:MAG: ATP-dependent RNA helicase HrpA, partial [Syntrophales bacterium]|nr:ATP-dependent RNA helicase HrpA [Syntrophales bacterium]